MRKINRIVIHCSATPPGWYAGKSLNDQITEIRRWHTDERGWRDIGYHVLVGRDGDVGYGRPIAQSGAHVRGHNADTIGVCLIGGHGASENDLFPEHFTPEQNTALRDVIARLQEQYGPLSVHGHNEFAAKGCPGFKVSDWYAQKAPRGPLKSKTNIGGAVAAAGGVGTMIVEAQKEVDTLTGTVKSLLPFADYLAPVFVGLTLAGAGFAIYSRTRDWTLKGRR